MFSYYALETWLFSFFALLLLGFIIFYTRRLIKIIADIRESKKVTYKPWDMEKKASKAKTKVPRRFGPFRSLTPVKESAITSKKQKQTKASPRTVADAVDGQIQYIDGNLNRYPSVSSMISVHSDETTTTNSEFYKERRLSVLSDINDNTNVWIIKAHIDQNQNVIKNDINSHISAAAVENLSSNLPKVASDKTNGINNHNDRNIETKEKAVKTTASHPGVILVTPEINNIPLSNGYYHYDAGTLDNKEHVEFISKVIPVLDESFTSSSTTIEGNNRSTITQTTSKKVTLTEVSERKHENRIKV